METKTVTGLVTKTNDAKGIIGAVFAVYGVLDLQGDIVHPGAMKRTFRERGGRVKVLDNHRTDTVLAILGKPLALKELTRNQLPREILTEHPEATGGAFASIQFLLDVPEGEGAYRRLRDGIVSEWSWGFDVKKHDYSEVRKNGKKVMARNLRDVELYEVSPTVFGAQPLAMTVSAKSYRRRDPIIDLILLRMDIEALYYGKPRAQLLAEIQRAQDEIAVLL